MYRQICGLALFITVTLCHEFYYSKASDMYRRSIGCQMCYQEQCMSLEKARCEYYAEANDLIYAEETAVQDMKQMRAQDENAAENEIKLRNDVDALLFNLVEGASNVEDKDCIPFMSQYTDCDKENICLGCSSCSCGGDGKWKCTAQICRAEKTINVDHKVLVMVMENLINSEDNKIRYRREVTDSPLYLTTNKFTYEELSSMWFAVKPRHSHRHRYAQSTTQSAKVYISDDYKPTTSTHDTTKDYQIAANVVNVDIINTTKGPITEPTTVTAKITDADNLAFEEVLDNIGIDQSYIRRKLPMGKQRNETIYDVDYMMILDDNHIAMHRRNASVPNILNIIDEYNSVEETMKDGKVVIDLLESATKNNSDARNVTDYIEIDKDNFDLNPLFENTNDIVEYDAVNIMKRDVTNIKFSEQNNVTQEHNNSTDAKCNLNTTVLYTLRELVSGVHHELRELKNIKENLINFTKAYNNTILGYNRTDDNTNPQNVADESNRKFRSNSPNILGLYIDKLKRDIYEVLRDVVGIQKYKNVSQLPEDLKMIIRAMKRYVSKEGKGGVKNYKSQIKKKIIDLRRYWTIYRQSSSPKNYIIEILKTLDAFMPKPKALNCLSTTAKKVVSRVISQYYVDEYSSLGLRYHDSSYNLTKDLESVGGKWVERATNVEKSSTHEKPFNMKLLHMSFTEDISKMQEALALIDFAHSRRAIPIFRQIEEHTAEKIKNGLQQINEKINVLIQLHNKITKMNGVTNKPYVTTESLMINKVDLRKQQKKKSFLKQIRNVLRGSKKDIIDLLKRRVPKAEIVKKITEKKMNEFAQKLYNEYEETMKRWQRNLDVLPRKKRSMLDTNGFRARMKNIIPKYLRGKVGGKVDRKKKNNDVTVHNNKTTQHNSNLIRTSNSKRKNQKRTSNPVTHSVPS